MLTSRYKEAFISAREKTWDVLVLGGGNAGLCAAISARRAGASVLVVESAPKDFRGGNSRHTRNLRCMHDAPQDVLTGAYPEEEFWQDLLKVTGGRTDERLARMVIRSSASCRDWMRAHGVRFQPSLGGTLHLSRTNAFFLGGGKALLNAYYRAAEGLGVEVLYEREAVGLEFEQDRFVAVTVKHLDRQDTLRARALVVASGGFESNLEWLREAWGPTADNFLIRGTPYNKGRMLRALIDAGAQSIGDPTQGHCVAIDARSPKFDGGIVTRVDAVSLGIVVNRDAKRFYDEGEEFWPKRYAIWGRLVAGQPGQIAHAIVDAKAMGRFIPPVYPPLQAMTIAELAAKSSLDPEQLESTIATFNAAVREGTFDHTVLDDCATEGLTPPKTHWARKIDTPPYFAYPLRPGITFTYLSVVVDERARVRMRGGDPAKNVFAAGEVMAGNILGQGYVGGFGMTIGTVFGRIAGHEAARVAR
ncbi:MAG: FAD-dependent tricarballylate dehydrogenase TcuA [Betaproteobacteria bacterium]|nr:FAD-dependent tricarballylate dehydrogenase TcuA [Betaproteobacteria bacterium]